MNKCINITIPWVEKYRPTNIDNIVLEDINKIIIKNIISKKQFPNLLLFGPPGTGKTTTIINLIKEYQKKNEIQSKDLIMDLNASVERGIDVVRTQIQQFVMSKTLFHNGTKFIILDEVDYMTKNAQHALKNIIQIYKNMNVRFCLICNYISRIEKCLQDECMNMRFTQLPKQNIIDFLKNIIEKENLKIDTNNIEYIYKYFDFDIRSMINYLQSNQNNMDSIKIINDNIIENLLLELFTSKDVNIFYKCIYNLSVEYNVERKHILESLFDFIIKIIYEEYNIENVELKKYIQKLVSNSNNEYIKSIKFILHNNNKVNIDYSIKFYGYTLLSYI
jgi:replication factor C subunit 3/5